MPKPKHSYSRRSSSGSSSTTSSSKKRKVVLENMNDLTLPDEAPSSSSLSSPTPRLHEDDEDDELRSRPPYFRITGRHQQRHRKPLYSLSWCSDTFKGKSGTEYQYLAICGHNVVTIYEVQVDSPRGIFQVKQSYKDEDKEEAFYACEFAGRSMYLANARVRRSDRRAASYAANGEDTSSSRSDYEDTDEEESESSSNGAAAAKGRTNGRSGSAAAATDNDDDATPETMTLLLEPEHCADTNYLNISDDSRSARGPQLLCVAGEQRVIKVIDPVQRKQVAILHGHGHDVYDLKACPTNEFLLLSASVDESIRLWSLESFSCVAIFAGQHGHDEMVLSLNWHVDGLRFVSSGKDQSIRLWNIQDGKVQEALQASRRLNPNQRRQSFHSAVQQFPYFVTKKVHRNVVDCVQFVGDMLLSKSTYNCIVLWKPVLPGGPTCTEGASAYNPPSDVIVLRTFDLNDCHLWFVRFAVDPIGRLLAVGTINGEVDIWDLDACQKKPSQKLKAIVKSTVRTLAFSPSGKILVTCCDNAQVCKWVEW